MDFYLWCGCSKFALRLVVTRINVLKNMKENQIKQTKKEIARCLENGEDQTAMKMVRYVLHWIIASNLGIKRFIISIVQVENFITEEKIMYAYKEIEINCRLILDGFNTINSQKYEHFSNTFFLWSWNFIKNEKDLAQFYNVQK